MAKRNEQREDRHLGLDNEQEGFDEETRPQQQTRGKVVQTKSQTTRRPSVRRKRDYNTHTTWTYELNKDLYHCHMEADKSVYGYSGRLRNYGTSAIPK